MKKIAFIIIFFFSNYLLTAQLNLIKDGSFEDTTVVWNTYTIARTLHHWNAIDTSTEEAMYFINQGGAYMSLYRTIDTNSIKLPYNNYFHQSPKYGHGSVNMVPYYDKAKYYNYWQRSVVRGYLRTNLVVGKQYCATIYATASEREGFFVTNGLGLYFDNGQIDTIVKIHKDSSGQLGNVTPQVQCAFLIDDTTNWMKIQGVFTANGTESHITIANFLPDSLLMRQPNFGASQAYWYVQNILIDNVSLIPTDIANWLPPTYTTPNADSVWVGLDKYDYADGKWYTIGMQYITDGPGFWYKGVIEGNEQFIHQIDVCGVPRYDTTHIVIVPLSIAQLSSTAYALKAYPNPASELVFVKNIMGNSIDMYNMAGQKIITQVVKNNEVKLNVSKIAKGIYVLKTPTQILKFVVY